MLTLGIINLGLGALNLYIYMQYDLPVNAIAAITCILTGAIALSISLKG